MKRIHSLLVLLAITILASIWENAQFSIKSITIGLLIAIAAELIVIFLEIKSSYLRYRQPKAIFQRLDRLRGWAIKRKLTLRYENEEEKVIFEELINIAIINVKSDNIEKKIAGLQHLHFIEPQVDAPGKLLIYNGLLNAFHQESNNVFRKILQESICEFFKICRRFL